MPGPARRTRLSSKIWFMYAFHYDDPCLEERAASRKGKRKIRTPPVGGASEQGSRKIAQPEGTRSIPTPFRDKAAGLIQSVGSLGGTAYRVRRMGG